MSKTDVNVSLGAQGREPSLSAGNTGCVHPFAPPPSENEAGLKGDTLRPKGTRPVFRDLLDGLSREFEILVTKVEECTQKNRDLRKQLDLLRKSTGDPTSVLSGRCDSNSINAPIKGFCQAVEGDVVFSGEHVANTSPEVAKRNSHGESDMSSIVPITSDSIENGNAENDTRVTEIGRKTNVEHSQERVSGTGSMSVSMSTRSSKTPKGGTRASSNSQPVPVYTTFTTGFAIGQFSQDDDFQAAWKRPGAETFMLRAKEVVEGTMFEMSFAALILINTLVMATEVQYDGIQIGYTIKFPGVDTRAEDAMPGATGVFQICEMAFGIVFFLEVVVKMFLLRGVFFRSRWNVFDLFIVIMWTGEKVINETFVMNPMILRILRLARLVRVARMIKTVQALDSLQVLIGSIEASFTVLAWSSVILLNCQLLVALMLHNSLVSFMTDPSIKIETRRDVFRYFGTFTRSMITMFELTLSNWIPVCRLLVDEVSEWYGLVMLSYKLVMGFAVIKVITGVFLHETFRVAATDDELMIVQKKRAIKKHHREMEKLFKMADETSDGFISRDEFKKVLALPRIRTWLAAMELEVEDYDLLFDFMDDGDQLISAEELMRGVQRLRGTARSIDLVAVMRKLLNIDAHLAVLSERIGGEYPDNDQNEVEDVSCDDPLIQPPPQHFAHIA